MNEKKAKDPAKRIEASGQDEDSADGIEVSMKDEDSSKVSEAPEIKEDSSDVIEGSKKDVDSSKRIKVSKKDDDSSDATKASKDDEDSSEATKEEETSDMDEDPSDVIGESLEDSANVNRRTVVKEDYSEYDGIEREGNHSGMSLAQTAIKPTVNSGMSGHLRVEDTG